MAAITKTRSRPMPGAVPLEDRVLDFHDDPETTTAGGLVNPVAARRMPQRGGALAVGPGRHSVSTGERISLAFDVLAIMAGKGTT